MRRSDSEHYAIQCSVVLIAGLMHSRYPELELLHAIPNDTKSASEGRRKKREGLKAGIPDLCLPVSDGHHGALYIEIKKPKGRTAAGVLNKAQKYMIPILKRFGNKVVVCYSAAEAIDELIAYLEIRRLCVTIINR